jgi:hypothetical protein
MSAATHSSVHTIEALVTMDPLTLSVIDHVRAVTLSPRRAKLRRCSGRPRPRVTCPITARIAPMNSDRFWYDESVPKPRNVKSTALTPLATSAPSTRSYQIWPAPLNDASNSAIDIGVVGTNDSIVRVNSASRYRTRHNIALQHWTTTVAVVVMLKSACGSFRPHVSAFSAPQNGRMTRHIFPYRVPQDASRCAVRRLRRFVTSVPTNPCNAVRKFFLAMPTRLVSRSTV